MKRNNHPSSCASIKKGNNIARWMLLVCLLSYLPHCQGIITNNSTNSTTTTPFLRTRQQGQQQIQERGGQPKYCANLPSSQNPRQTGPIRLQRRVYDGDEVSRQQQRIPFREYYLWTPPNYDPTVPTKVLLYFHGWKEDAYTSLFFDSEWMDALADPRHDNYIVVAPQGLDKSWQFPGSSDGMGQNGRTVTTCDASWPQPDDCHYQTCNCQNRCGWTQCQDDDVEFVLDLIHDLPNHVCVDEDHIYAAGISNGGMLTWSLGQDRRTAPWLAGIAPMIGVPHYDYTQGKASPYELPVIGFYGYSDPIVPPGTFWDDWTKDSSGYYWVPAHRMHTTWAQDHGCNVHQFNGEPPNVYFENSNLQGFEISCKTHCPLPQHESDLTNPPPYSVDCRVEMGHETPAFMMQMALRFFEQHDRYTNPSL